MISPNPPAGDDCPYSHGIYEMLLHPMRYRVTFCRDQAEGGVCHRDVCFFAHESAELRQADVESLYRFNVLVVRPLRYP